ncbi:MAG: hypothetical protein MJZ34_01765 [Paludibacteraceae bacterium]|nr:hypothetical protein [Paludibacteraceae bacterium]
MTRTLLIVLFPLSIILWGCNSEKSNNTTDSQNNESELTEPYDLDDSSTLNEQSNLGDLNNDGLKDSVALITTNNNTTLSIYLGKDNNHHYEKWNSWVIPFLSMESGAYIREEGLLILAESEYYRYTYQWKDNELYMKKIERTGDDQPYHCIDFERNELKIEIDLDSVQYIYSPIREDKRPQSLTLKSTLSNDFNSFMYYDEEYINSIIDSFKNELSDQQNKIHSFYINNDTLLKLRAEMRDEIYLELLFSKKGLSSKAIQQIEKDFCQIVSSWINVEGNDFNTIFYDTRDKWEAENYRKIDSSYSEAEAYGYNEIYSIEPIYTYEDLVTYSFFHHHGGHEYEENFDCEKTYNRITGESFSWDMIQKDEAHLNIPSNETEGNKSPSIRDSLLEVVYDDYGTMEYYARNCSETGFSIPISNVIPFLTEEGKQFFQKTAPGILKIHQ